MMLINKARIIGKIIESAAITPAIMMIMEAVITKPEVEDLCIAEVHLIISNNSVLGCHQYTLKKFNMSFYHFQRPLS